MGVVATECNLSRFRCCYCGRFVRWDADRSTAFGRYYDLEPPDEEFYCDRCIEKYSARDIQEGRKPVEWRLAEWQKRVTEAIERRAAENGSGSE